MTNRDINFRRQFLLAPQACDALNHWQHVHVGAHHVYAHPDVELSVATSSDTQTIVVLVGYIIDPDTPDSSNLGILSMLAEVAHSADKTASYLRCLAGRFVLIVITAQDVLLFHDPCGLRTAYYTHRSGKVYVASQPLLLAIAIPLDPGTRLAEYLDSTYVKTHLEHWLPSGCTVYDNVKHLVPNHYLQFSTFEQVRYWPAGKLPQRPPSEIAAEVSDLLSKLLVAAANRFKLALPLTAGWDSRLLLGASRRISSDVFYYTLQYRSLSLSSNDIRIPQQLSRTLGLQHHLIDCRKAVPQKFRETYENNVTLAHMKDWGEIAYGMADEYPQDRVCVKGNCSEIARCFYYKYGSHQEIASADHLVAIEDGWNEVPFIRDQVHSWFAEARETSVNAGMDILDLFYWEHRMGSWQAQSQLEWDIVQEAYTPFNHRELLELMLSVPAEFRCAPNYSLYGMIMSRLWPLAMTHPVNPTSVLGSCRRLLGSFRLVRRATKIYRRALASAR